MRGSRTGSMVVILLATLAAVMGVLAVGLGYFLVCLVLGGFYRGTVCVGAYALVLTSLATAWTRFADDHR